MIPGEIITSSRDITLNQGKPVTSLKIANLGDRPIQVGSHFHFFEVNKLLQFERKQAFGKRLNIPSGTAVRFEPGEIKTVELIEFSGKQQTIGFNDLVNNKINAENLVTALEKITTQNFSNSGDHA